MSSADQNAARQMEKLDPICDLVFVDQGVTGSTMDRPQLTQALSILRPGSCLVVASLDRLGRTTRGVLQLLDELAAREVAVRVLDLGMDTSTPSGRLMATVISAVAELELSTIRERQRQGIEAARNRQVRFGRPPSLTPEQQALARDLIAAGRTYRSVAALMSTSTRSVERAVKG